MPTLRISVAKKRKRKLLDNEKVEVRSYDDGFLGSWHSGTVISSEKGSRLIEYDHIVSDINQNDSSVMFIDSINVSDAIEGDDVLVFDSCYRGRIHPVPPLFDFDLWGLSYGQCVDVYYKDAWWEGVIFDSCDGCKERRVFFPDIGDELKVDVGSDLRVSQDWDECSGDWKPRGKWLFLELVSDFEKECWPLVVSVKQVWYDLRVKNGFDENLKEWTCCRSDVWKELLFEVVVDNVKLTINELFQRVEFSRGKKFEECNVFSVLNGPDLYALMKSKPENSGDEVVSVVESNRLGVMPLSALVKPTLEDEEPCVSPPKLAIEASCSNREKSCRRSRKVSKKSKHQVWISCDILPEYCADAVEKYLKVYGKLSKTKNGNLLHDVTMKLRSHLLYLGWEVKSFQDKVSRRWRYTQPDGSRKCFRSLLTVCEHFRKSRRAKVPPFLQDEQNRSSPFLQDEQNRSSDAADPMIFSPLVEQSQGCKNEVIKTSCVDDDGGDVLFEPEYCPLAVIDYYSLKIKINVQPSGHDKHKDMQLKAKKHLSAVGWQLYLMYKDNSQLREMRYRSPSGKIYYSLQSACKGYLKENRDVWKLAERQLGGEGRCSSIETKLLHGKHKKKRKTSDVHPAICSRSSNSAEVSLNCAVTDGVLGARKRVREGVVSSTYHTNPQTILSWLIDNNVVLPRDKVYCGRTRDDKTSEGKTTRDGIKCSCCQEIFTPSNFQFHAIGTHHQPSAHIYLEDGRSLLECQMQLRRDKISRGSTKESKVMKNRRKRNDNICAICHFGGELLLCDQCPSSFHTRCLGLKKAPDGDWFCRSCCCNICGVGGKNDGVEVFIDKSVVKCYQCELQYHVACLRVKDHVLESNPKGNWFCSKACERVSLALQKLVGKPIRVGVDNLTWTLLKYLEPDECDHDPSNSADSIENYSKLNVALGVMHECFRPMREPRTKRDLVEDVIFNKCSELNHLNFRGFYTVLLEKNDEVISVANVRIYGEKVAEMPLVATRFVYRRRGMCRVLMNELEKVLKEVGVERLVLPAVSNVLKTWVSSFGFSTMSKSERLKLLDYAFLDFRGTTMCQKYLVKKECKESSPQRKIKHHCGVANGNVSMDIEVSQGGNLTESIGNNVSGVCKVEGRSGCKEHQKKHGDREIICYKRRKISKPVGS